MKLARGNSTQTLTLLYWSARDDQMKLARGNSKQTLTLFWPDKKIQNKKKKPTDFPNFMKKFTTSLIKKTEIIIFFYNWIVLIKNTIKSSNSKCDVKLEILGCK